MPREGNILGVEAQVALVLPTWVVAVAGAVVVMVLGSLGVLAQVHVVEVHVDARVLGPYAAVDPLVNLRDLVPKWGTGGRDAAVRKDSSMLSMKA